MDVKGFIREKFKQFALKRWTVILIPHGGGDSRNAVLRATHLWSVAGIVAVSSMAAGFWFFQSRSTAETNEVLQDERFSLRGQLEAVMNREVYTEHDLQKLEERLRNEYEEQNAVVADALADLYELEAEVREVAGIPPRDDELESVTAAAGGQGGPPPKDEMDELEEVAPPKVIYDSPDPPVDLILLEIEVRKESLQQLLDDLRRRQDELDRIPTGWPVTDDDRWMSSSFGHRKDPFTGQRRQHNGVDLVANLGTDVVATAKGTVVYAGRQQYYGNVIKIDHGNGIQTWYGHLHKILVKKGASVKGGERIGLVGSTGRSSGPHVHYEVRIDDKVVNPRSYLGD